MRLFVLLRVHFYVIYYTHGFYCGYLFCNIETRSLAIASDLFVYMLQSYDTVVQHTFAILTNAVFIRENSE